MDYLDRIIYIILEVDFAIASLNPVVLIFKDTFCIMRLVHIFDLLLMGLVGETVVIINANENQMQIFKRRQVEIHEVKDFVAQILSPCQFQRETI